MFYTANARGVLMTSFLVLGIALSSMDPEVECTQGRCMQDEMNLLQVHTDSTAGAKPIVGHETAVAVKQSYPFYHTSAEIHEAVELLAEDCGGAMKLETHSEGGVDIDVVNVRAAGSTPVNKVFILFGEHSRELISPESGLHLLKVLCGKVALDGKANSLVPSVLQDSEFQLVLNANPLSRDKVEKGEYCLRTNPKGVDLNRNWDEKWALNTKGETWSGPTPFSEPETKVFKKVVEKFQPTTFLTVHSGTKGMYMPWAYDLEHTGKFNAPQMLNVLKDLDQAHCQCPYGAAGKEVGYPCPGTCLDWVYEKLRTPYVFAFEIYTDPAEDDGLKRRWEQKLKEGGLQLLQSGSHLGHEHFADLFNDFGSDFVHTRAGDLKTAAREESCFKGFNPPTEKAYKETVQNWASAYLEMAANIAKELKTNATAIQRR